ncbi:Uncharacterized protein dnm_090880 [Desulfonema magnum]|uniref:Uncharacterized protein n=1 Tax=Desulfonema magnum TaxID=45655 RepID=A0A975BXI2_9BACT|nr:Uncharacterized protein dnm_090880 [Desulfonema magnum]
MLQAQFSQQFFIFRHSARCWVSFLSTIYGTFFISAGFVNPAGVKQGKFVNSAGAKQGKFVNSAGADQGNFRSAEFVY